MNSNVKEPGGERWIIGGTIEMSDGTHFLIGESTLESILNAKFAATKAEIQVNSTATTIADLKADFNALLTRLKTAGIMSED